MRRGFLNSKAAKERLSSATAQQFEQIKVTSVDLPAVLEKPVVVPGSTFSPTDPPTHIWATLPQLYGEPSTECVLLRGSKEIILKTPGFPKRLPPANSPAAFRVAPSPGKGMGLFSTRPIKQGEIILWERPLLIAPRGVPTRFPPGSFSAAQMIQHHLDACEHFIAIAVNRMEENCRAAFMSLHNCHTHDGSGPLVGRFRTNGVALGGLDGVQHQTDKPYNAILEHVSRLNHSCSPNTQPFFDRATFAYKLYAVRDVPAGEELTYQYIDVLANKTARAESLKPYDVVCTCLACTENIAETDKRRSEIANIFPFVPTWLMNYQLPDDWLIKKCTALLELIDKEGLQHLEGYCMGTRAIMDSYICLGDSRNASKWAARVALRPWSECEAESYPVKELLDPGSPAYAQHPLWQMRMRMWM